jgi:hypothetical protein
MNKTVKSAPRRFPKLAPVVSLPQPSSQLSADSRACIANLKDLLRRAERGKLFGFAYMAMCGDDFRCFDLHTEAIGAAEEHKLFTIGALAALTHDLMEKECQE